MSGRKLKRSFDRFGRQLFGANHNPQVAPPSEMPTQEDLAVRQAKRRAELMAFNRRGRASTILSQLGARGESGTTPPQAQIINPTQKTGIDEYVKKNAKRPVPI